MRHAILHSPLRSHGVTRSSRPARRTLCPARGACRGPVRVRVHGMEVPAEVLRALFAHGRALGGWGDGCVRGAHSTAQHVPSKAEDGSMSYV